MPAVSALRPCSWPGRALRAIDDARSNISEGETIAGPLKKSIMTNQTKLQLIAACSAQDIAAIEAALNGLNAVWQAASQEMYSAAGAPQGAPSGAGANQGQGPTNENGNAGGTSEATDVEYEEVKDKK